MQSYQKGFVPYALAAGLIGLVGGFSTVLGPAFVQDLGIAYQNTTWTALAQAISTAACAPILGRLGDLWGRRRTLLAGLALFTLGNALTAGAASLPAMLMARFTVGLGTAATAPVIMAYILGEFPREQVARGFSAYMLISSASVICGPSLGALMVARWGWRSMAALCVGLCLAVLAGTLPFQENAPAGRGSLRDFDGPGAALVVVCASALLCVPSFGQNFGWTSPAFGAVLVGSMLALGGLIWAERRAKDPILSAKFIFRRRFLLSVLALFLTQGLMQANMTNLIVFINYTQPGNTALSGYAISVLYLGMSLGAVSLGPLADRLEPRHVLLGSLSGTALGCGLMLLFSEQTALWLLMLSLGVLGLGLGGNGTIFLKVALSGLPADRAGAGAGTYGLFRDLAAPFGVAVLVPLFTNRVAAAIAGGMEAAPAAVAAIRQLALAELACVMVGMVAVGFLPNIHQGGRKNATGK